jgi:hypothetical protein
VCIGGDCGVLGVAVVCWRSFLYALLVIVIFGSCCGVLEMVVACVGGNCGVCYRWL